MIYNSLTTCLQADKDFWPAVVIRFLPEVKEMKKTISLILIICLLLPGISLADVRSQIDAPTNYQAVWQSNTGKTIVTVQAAVEIPATQQMMIYPASLRTFTVDDFRRVADACFGDTPHGTLPASLDSVTQPGTNSDPTNQIVRATEENAEGNLALLAFDQLRGHDGRLWYGMIQYEGRGAARYQVMDLPKTGQADPSCREKAVSIAQTISPQLGLAYEGLCERYEADGFSSIRYGNMFIFTRVIDGAPIVWTNKDCQAYDNLQDTYNLKTPYEVLKIIIDPADGTVWLLWQAPHAIDTASGESMTLLSFDQIMGVAEQLLPLKYQFQEQYLAYRNQDANRFTVSRITLSYIRMQNRNAPSSFSMVPVWDFFSAEDPSESLLTLSAVDGTVIDRGFGY